MSQGHILFDGVWKRFRRGPAHNALRDFIPAAARHLLGRNRDETVLAQEEFWAIRDVSFEVRPGETLGIIGGNGAGKSTTLKLLTHILQATRGVARVQGRVGALIEISAVFHLDLTGRENVFLQGAIMGMPQSLIRERFDDIVDFSGVGPFIDTPAKRYSSGMNARLGFSIAVHLEPDVLIVDEVLSVGDTEFQTRAFDRMRTLANSGLPVVIVSHQLERIADLCTRGLLLRNGVAAFEGTPHAAIAAYLGSLTPSELSEKRGDYALHIGALEAHWGEEVPSGKMVSLMIRGTHREPTRPNEVELHLLLRDVATGQSVFRMNVRQLDAEPADAGEFLYDLAFDANVPAGLYRVESSVFDRSTRTVMQDGPTAPLRVIPTLEFAGSTQLNVRRASPTLD